VFAKVQYSCPEKYGSVIAPWFNQINTFLFGGVTQHGEFVGNVCADLNGMGGGGPCAPRRRAFHGAVLRRDG